MDDFYSIFISDGFQRALHNFAVVSVILAIGAVAVAFAFYGRAQERDSRNSENSKWVLLFATWRDSLIITLLFVAESFMYRYMDFSSFSQAGSGIPSLVAPTVVPIAVFIIQTLIFVVASLRIISISRWISNTSLDE